MRRAGTGRSVWLENSTGFDRWCGLQRFGDPGGPGLDPRVTRIAARRVDTHVPRESSRLAAGRNRRVLPGVSTGACQSAWESAAGRKNEHRPTAGRDHARAERRRRRVTRIRGRDVHSPRGYVRTFLARLGRTGVRLACAAAVKHRLSRLSISPSSQDIFDNSSSDRRS